MGRGPPVRYSLFCKTEAPCIWRTEPAYGIEFKETTVATCVISATAANLPLVNVIPTKDESPRKEQTQKNAPEASLVQRAQRGDEEAFEALYQAHKKRVYSVCLQMTKNNADAEDLTQEAFLQVFRSINSFRGDSAFSTWLYRIAVNTVLMKLRRRKAPPLVSLDEPVSAESTSLKREVGRADLNLNGVVDRIALGRAMEDLPAGCRQIFDLNEVEGYQHHEIAGILECSIGNSKSQLHKAKMKMRDVLFPKRKSQKVSLTNDVTRRTAKTIAENSGLPACGTP